MRLLLSLFVLTAAPALAAEAPPTADRTIDPRPALAPLQKPCPGVTGLERIDTPEDRPMRARKLTEAPPANMELTVLRQIDGCPAPVIVRYGVDRRPQEPVTSR